MSLFGGVSPTVLVAEDSEDTRHVLSLELRHYGCRVITATDGREAVERALAAHPDLILMALNAAHDRLKQRFRDGMISETTWEQVEPELKEEIRRSHEAQQELLRETPELRAEELADARRECLRAQRAELVSLFGEGVISERVYAELTAEVDSALASADAAEQH